MRYCHGPGCDSFTENDEQYGWLFLREISDTALDVQDRGFCSWTCLAAYSGMARVL